MGTRLIRCPIAGATVAICGYRVRRAECLDPALSLVFGLRIRWLLILHTREIRWPAARVEAEPLSPKTTGLTIPIGALDASPEDRRLQPVRAVGLPIDP